MTWRGPSWFQRYLLPGFAFKAVVIGGGYATGRELAEYFIPSGPQGGCSRWRWRRCCGASMCALTFLFARSTRSYDYRSFFATCSGRSGSCSKRPTCSFMVLILAVFGAAAGAIGEPCSAGRRWPARCA